MAEPTRTIPNDITHIEQTVSLERLASARGVKLTKSGSALTGTCPFHPASKKAPAITITPSTNTWTCSKCKIDGGTVVQWTMKAEGISKRHAVELLRADHGVGGSKVVKSSSVTKLPDVITTAADDTKLLGQAASYYADALTRNVKALDFLRSHGIARADTVARFRIGLSDRTLGYRIPKANRKGGAEVRGRLHDLGVMKDTGHETLRGCITLPLTDANGVVVSMYGRRMKLDTRTAETVDVYLNTKGLFNVEAFTTSKEIILCSTPWEALIMACAGIGNVSAVHDGNADELLDAIIKMGTSKVTLAFPRTSEGEATTTSIRERLVDAGVEVHRALPPAGMNIESFVESAGADALAQVIRQAEWIGGTRPVNTPAPATTLPTPGSKSSGQPIITSSEIVFEYGDRRWRVRGLASNTSYERLRVHLFVSREHRDSRLAGFHVDHVELYAARQRNAFVEEAAHELGLDADVVKRDLGQVLLRLEELQDEQIRAALKPKQTAPTMSEQERDAALALLRDPKLIERIVTDFDRCGVVGEADNKLLGYLTTVSRKLNEPLAVLVQSSSASGKSSLLDAVLSFTPEEDRAEFSAMTGQALYYMEPGALRHKVLSIAEEAGAERASYALKLLQSSGSLTIASTAKEAGTGRMTTHEYRVEGPVALMLTTTATSIDDELSNRCIVLTVNEGREQTKAIHRRQREQETLAGVLARHRREAVLLLHRNAQRLLAPVVVVNPFARELSFPDGSTRARRDHRKYLTLIRTVALLHQHQREVKSVEHDGTHVEYIEVTKADIEIADRLMRSVLDTADELPPHTRHVLGMLDTMVSAASSEREIERADYRFTRRDAREALGIGSTQLWTHMKRLVDAEYLIVHGSKRGRGVVYELAVLRPGSPRTTVSVRGDGTSNSGVIRPSFGPDSGQVRVDEKSPAPEKISSITRERSGASGSNQRTKGRPSRRTSAPNGAG